MDHKRTTVRFIKIAAGVSASVSPTLAARGLERLFLTPSRRPMAEREKRWMKDAEQSEVRFDDSRKLAVYSWGWGPTVLLAHGWSGRASQMAVFASPLVERGFQVVAFDAPGHGEAEGRLSGLPEMATALERVAEEVGPLHGIVAHSLGTTATTIGLSRGLEVGRVVYVAPPDEPGRYLYRAARFLGFGDEVARHAQPRIEGRFGYRFDQASGPTLTAGLDVPLLVIHDRRDGEVPYEEGLRLVEQWSGAQHLTTRGLGHHRILRDDDVVSAALEFLGTAEDAEMAGYSAAEDLVRQRAFRRAAAHHPQWQ